MRVLYMIKELIKWALNYFGYTFFYYGKEVTFVEFFFLRLKQQKMF